MYDIILSLPFLSIAFTMLVPFMAPTIQSWIINAQEQSRQSHSSRMVLIPIDAKKRL
ncbi:hypothetical protein N9R79_08810 [Vibrio sp.]|nr:hypothetical protein [Vibrio sp.]